MDTLILALLVSLGINLAMFIPAFILKTDKITDISYAATFAAVAIFGYAQSTQSALHLVILLLVLLWAIRLGGFLYIRINAIGRDARFDGMREKFFPFLRFWLLQGVTVFVVMVAALLGFGQDEPQLSGLSLLGIGVFLSGLIIEAVADAQKFRFNSNPKNKAQWIDTGIWKASRHPNYLGEMMVWIGMYLLVASSLGTGELLAALISPGFIIVLLMLVSGVPLLEKSAEKKWGGRAAFKRYRAEVPVILPTVSSLRRAFK